MGRDLAAGAPAAAGRLLDGLPRLGARRAGGSTRGDGSAVGRDGNGTESRPAQPRPADLRRVETHRHRAAVRPPLERCDNFREDGMQRVAVLAIVTAVLAGGVAARAQDWPARPVTMVVPFAPGGVYDTFGRVYAASFSELLHQQVIVENVPGAGG